MLVQNKMFSSGVLTPVTGRGLNTGIYFDPQLRPEDSISRTISQFSSSHQSNNNNQSIITSGSSVPLPIQNRELKTWKKVHQSLILLVKYQYQINLYHLYLNQVQV